MSEVWRTEALWTAGSVADCGGGPVHRPVNIHVIVRCVCGAAYMSTDAGLAFGMAEDHATQHRGQR